MRVRLNLYGQIKVVPVQGAGQPDTLAAAYALWDGHVEPPGGPVESHGERLACAGERLLQRHRDRGLRRGASALLPRQVVHSGPAPPPSASGLLPEELFEKITKAAQAAEQIFEAFSPERDGPSAGGLGCATAEDLLPVHAAVLIGFIHLLVSRTPVGIAQDLVG